MDEGIMLTIGDDGIARAYDDTYDITIHCESAEEQEKAKKLLMERTELQWIPVTDGDEWKPPVDEDGYSDFILLSFSNVGVLCIGQYRGGDEGGAFFEGDDDEPLFNRGFIVNAWMPLPAPYREE
jgi:hypothetical protein